MKYYSRLNQYKSSNFLFDCATRKAFSYGWWQFVGTYKNLLIFNNTTYSMSTCKHQGKAWSLLDYKADITLRYTRKSMTEGMEAVLKSEIVGIRCEIEDLERQILKPRTHKAKNEERRGQIAALRAQIDLLNNLIAR
jgi:hypothetical protein